MAQYFVRKSGNDGNDGLSAATAFLTVDHAANSVGAGDSVVIGAGIYRELVTMDTSGSAGSAITYIGDIRGEYTGDIGLVIITAFDSETQVPAARTGAVNLNGKQFITWQYVTFIGGNSALFGSVYSAVAGNYTFEGLTFFRCQFLSDTLGKRAIYIDANLAGTPATTGLTVTHCYLEGGLIYSFDENASADVNLKVFVDHCVIFSPGAAGVAAIQFIRGTTSTFFVGGATITNCTIVGGGNYGFYFNGLRSTTFPSTVKNNLIYRTEYGFVGNALVAGCLISDQNIYIGSSISSAWFLGVNDRVYQTPLIMGGFSDFILRQNFGWSPLNLWEPGYLDQIGYTHLAIGTADPNAIINSTDYYNNPSMGILGDGPIFYFDASDDAVTDPNNVWTSEANIVDNGLTSNANTGTLGSSASNYVFAGGTNCPGGADDSLIYQVNVRARYQTSANTTGQVQVYTDGLAEDLGGASFGPSATVVWSDWTAISTPAGGWTWAKISALEFKTWRSSVAGLAIYVYMIQIQVNTCPSPDVGAVESRRRPVSDTVTYRSAPGSGRIDGSGMYETLVPVRADTTDISIWLRKNAAYSGDQPTLKVLTIPGDTDKTATMTVGASTWEKLTCSFTPTEQTFVRVRIETYSNDPTGGVNFDDME